jgi:Secretion system C-terminal sorting domain
MNKLLIICFSFFLSAFVINAQHRTFTTTGEVLKAPVFKSVQTHGVQSAITHTPDDTLNYLNPGFIYGVTGDGFVVGDNKYGDLGKYQRFDLSQSYLLKGFMFYTRVRVLSAPYDTLNFVVKSVNGDGSPGTTLATVRKSTDLLATSGWNTFTLSNPLPVGKSIFIGYEWTAAVKDTFGLASDAIGLGNGNGALRAWEKGSDGSYIAMQTSWGASFDVDLWITAIAEKVLPISEARIDANADLIPDRLNDTLTIAGVVFTPNYQTSNRSYYIWDGTGGLCTFKGGLLSPALNLGDSVVIRGYILQYNGLDEINLNTDTDIWVVGTNAKLPTPIIIPRGTYNTNTEQYECLLVQVQNVTKVSGTWPGAGGSANIVLTNGADTLTIRVDSDTDIDGNPEPVWPKDVIGVMTQFSATSLSAGYQIQPRYYATDFPAATVPVELISLSASVCGKSVIINWTTATEKNNMGFEIQRSSDKSSFVKIGYVNGSGTTTELKRYSFADNNVLTAKNYYRLKQMDYDGSYKYSPVVEAEIGAISSYSLDQNYPNPFNPTTQIKYSLLSNSNVKITIFNALGESIKELANEVQQSGVHIMNFNAAGLSSGVYFYSIQANSVDGSQSFRATKKMILMK